MRINSIQMRLLGGFFLIFIIFLLLNYFQYEQLLSGKDTLPVKMRFLSVAAIFSLTLGALVFFLDKTITHPIKKMTKAANDIRMGNLRVKIDIKPGDELGQLADIFNELTAKLKASTEKIEKLETHSRDLDKLIYSRTRELNTKIEDLTKMKTAILNMMEDTDDTNVKLLVSRERLKKSVFELKELDVRKDQFISIAAHELKTPITAIRGFSDLLQTGKLAEDPEARNKYLGIINTEIKRLGKLVDDILDLSRIDIGKIRLTFDKVDVYDVIESVKRMTTMEVSSKNLFYNFDIQKGLPQIVSDKERLEQILINLVGNAVKFTDKGSITITAHKQGRDIHFTVKDSGVGIPKKDIKKVFERFYQVESHLTRKAVGAGLGLSICQEIVKLMNGSIWAESEIGKGSTLHVLIPINPYSMGGIDNK